jgi:hypothetical protein
VDDILIVGATMAAAFMSQRLICLGSSRLFSTHAVKEVGIDVSRYLFLRESVISESEEAILLDYFENLLKKKRYRGELDAPLF